MTPKQLITARIALGLSQGQLATALGYVRSSAVWRWEHGKPLIPEDIAAKITEMGAAGTPAPDGRAGKGWRRGRTVRNNG